MLYSILYYLFLVIFLIIYSVFISLVWLFTVLFDKKRSVIAVTTYYHALSVFLFSPRWKVKIEGIENIDRSKNYVVVSNHQGFLDIPLIHMLKLHVRWVAKKELIKMPFVGHAMLIHGDILLDRKDPQSAKTMMKKALKILGQGVSVAIFPEGTRSKTGRMGRFKDGAFLVAKRAGADILPLVIDGTKNVVNGWKLIVPHAFTIKVLPVIPKEKVRDTDVKTLTSEVHDIILREHQLMRPDLYEDKND